MRLKIEELSLEQKINMVLCMRRLTSPADLEYTLEMIRKHAVGCVQVPIGDKTPEIMKAIYEAADYPILVFADTEQGYPRSGLPMIPAMSFAACNRPEAYHAFARGVAHFAKADGFTGTWGPVVDILRGDGPCRVSRHFGDTPDKVSAATVEISRQFKKSGFISTGKHYPGGSDKPIDTHMAEGFSDVSEQELIEFDLAPYFERMKQGVLPAVMTHHCTYTKIDPEYPASLSKKVLDILRNRGFDGVFFTDSLAMMGILQKYGEENVMGMAIAAGNDIVLPNYRTPSKTCFDMLMKNYQDGVFSEERLNDAVRHVLALQDFVADNADIVPPFSEADRECLENVARDCITAITDEGVAASLGDVNKRRLFVVLTEQGFDCGPQAELPQGKWYDPKGLSEKIKAEFPNSEVHFLPEFSTAGENDKLLTAATKHDEVVFVTYCSTAAYQGTDCLTRRTEAVFNCLALSGKVSAVVHFGNPYAIKPLSHVPRRVFGYSALASQKYAIEVLAGKIPARGTMPFDIDFD